jgi:hypothetical protein
MNFRYIQTEEFAIRARAHRRARDKPASAQMGGSTMPRRQFLKTAGVVVLGAALWRPGLAAAQGAGDPVPIPGGTPFLGGAFHVFAPAAIPTDPADAEPSTITDFDGFLGLAYVTGTVTQTNTVTGVVRTLPFVGSDMRFMKGAFRGQDGQIHQGAFGLV